MSKLFLLLFLFSYTNENKYMKIIEFDYSQVITMQKEYISIFESIDYYLSLLFKKNEVKDYNSFHKMYRDLTKKKLNCGKNIIINYNKNLLIQKDISFLIIPKLMQNSKIKEFDFRNTSCKDEYSIPRVITIILQYNNYNILESILKNEIQRKYLFNRFIQIIFGNTILELNNLKRNKLISAFPEKYLYFSSYKKFLNLTEQKEDLFSDNFIYIGNYSYLPAMPYFNDYLMQNITIEDSLKSSFTEISLNILEEYPYELAHCDLLFYRKKKCYRVDQKCIDDCSLERYFMEYYIDEKNKKLICNLKTKDDLKNQKCSSLYGNVFYHEFIESKNFNEYIQDRDVQQLLLLKPSPKCPKSHPRTIFFEYTDYYRDDPYYYIKNKINVDYLELKDSKYFVIGKIDKEKNYMTKYKCLISNNILTNDLPHWNYNIYWDLYPDLNDRGIFFNHNKYQLIGKFPDENINLYYINLFYNKLKDKYPKDFNYMLETFSWPEQKELINNKFSNYIYNTQNVWILKSEKNTKYKYPHIFNTFNEIKNNNEKLIINKYLTNPMLINNKKFSMKTFVLVTGFSPLKIYFYRDGYLTFAKHNFTLNGNDLNNPCIHISSDNKEFKCLDYYNNKYIYGRSLFDEKCFIWNYLNFERYCKKENINYNNIIKQIKDIIIKTFISLSPDIINKMKNIKINDSNMFQLFTFDFILDANYKAYLIDIDKKPNLDSIHLAPIYIYDHLISDILNIVGVVPFSHDELEKTFDKVNYKYENKIMESVDNALCEFSRPKGVFELIFPLKNNINDYIKYFEIRTDENNFLWDKLLNSKEDYN